MVHKVTKITLIIVTIESFIIEKIFFHGLFKITIVSIFFELKIQNVSFVQEYVEIVQNCNNHLEYICFIDFYN